MLASIDTDALLELVWVAPVASITVALAYSLCIVGFARAADARRSGANTAATLYGVLAVIAFLAFAGLVITGVLVITSKD